MNYQFAPFRMGVSDVTPEELENMKKKANEVAVKLVSNTVLGCLFAAAYVSSTTGDLMLDASKLLRKGALSCFDGAIRCHKEMYRIEGEVLVIKVVA